MRAAVRGPWVGAALIADAEALAAGYTLLQLTSNAPRDGAPKFYEGQGFVGSHVGLKRALDREG